MLCISRLCNVYIEVKMKDCAIYIETAIKNSNLKNRAELCRILNIKQPSLFTLEKGKTLPSESTMIKLAELAGLPKEEALIDLNLWRSKNKPELQKVWQRLAKMIGCVLLISLFFAEKANAYELQEPIAQASSDIDYENTSKFLYELMNIFLTY